MTQSRRRTGWKNRRSLRVINAKAPDQHLVRDPAHAYGYAHYESWPDQFFDDDGDSWHGCGHHGCCVDDEWAINYLPPMIFSQDGLVHISKPKDPTAICGEASNWPAPNLASTDEAIAYAKKYRGDLHDITCLACVTLMHLWDAIWTDL